jgi:hypothetical protein
MKATPWQCNRPLGVNLSAARSVYPSIQPRITRLMFAAFLCIGAPVAVAADLPDVVTQDAARFTVLLNSPGAERRGEGVQGLANLKCWAAEDSLLNLVRDPSPLVQREVVLALGRLGSGKSVPQFIRWLTNPSWEIRQNAWLSLCRMTAQSFPADQPGLWQQWWDAGAPSNHEAMLLAAATTQGPESKTAPPSVSSSLQTANHPGAPKMPALACSRHDALRALRHFATPASEPVLISLLHKPDLSYDERVFVAEALERAGTAKSIPVLAGFHSDAAAWALGRIGGPEAEQALLQFPKTLGVLLNLDRLHSTNCGGLLPHLVSQMGLVTYRGQPDDLMQHEAQPIQRAGANLIRRSGLAPALINQVLLELEYTMNPPPAAPRPPMPPEWRPMLEAMRSELKPGFVREDGVTTSQPLTALYHVATDRSLVPRLKPLLRHPAFVPRIYVAMTLGRLQATETLPDLLAIVREGYPFSDSVALASGKHFDQSQTVRWRGFLCMAVGGMGGEDARVALEQLAADPQQSRDIRYGSVVGVGFIGSVKSLPALRAVATNDIIWMVRDEARRVRENIEVLNEEGPR